MNINQLKQHLAVSDLDFVYNGKSYFICPFSDYYSAGGSDKDGAEYDTFEHLIYNFLVQGKPLKDVIKDIDW